MAVSFLVAVAIHLTCDLVWASDYVTYVGSGCIFYFCIREYEQQNCLRLS